MGSVLISTKTSFPNRVHRERSGERKFLHLESCRREGVWESLKLTPAAHSEGLLSGMCMVFLRRRS